MTAKRPGRELDPEAEEERRLTRRTWIAIAVGTVIQVVSFGALLFGALVSLSDDPTPGAPSFALGFILAPATFASVAFISGHERAPTATLKAMGLWLVLALSLGVLNPVTGLCAAFGAAGVITLRREEWTSTWVRAIAVVVGASYVLLLVVLVPEAGIFAGAVTPLLAVRAGDVYQARSREREG
ncbi:MAG: hypothetical protein DWQ40_11555 [Actinobacteria bacterium]|nr:MAG: hypothetical protein DWQ40_11555 [Actinomycetota bacterium]